MRDCSMSWHIIMPSISRTQSVSPHYCLYCKLKFFKIPSMTEIQPPATKKPLLSGRHSLSEFVFFPSLCDEDVSEKVNQMLAIGLMVSF